MAQHFLLSAHARTLSLGTVVRMRDAEAESAFAAVRWPGTNGNAVARTPGPGLGLRDRPRPGSGLAAGTSHEYWPLVSYQPAESLTLYVVIPA
jgi:hypothetical protein